MSIKYATYEEAEEINRIKAREYYKQHKEERRAYEKQYYYKNREKILERKKNARKQIQINQSNYTPKRPTATNTGLILEIVNTEPSININIDIYQMERLLNNAIIVNPNNNQCY
jgi:hypothetical protein